MGPIVLVGPMGAGKTTLGKRLAKILDLPFVDTDKMVTSEHGSIKELFATKGEAHFRVLESAALARALGGKGVVATGGGIVLSKANRALLTQNATIFLRYEHGICASLIQRVQASLTKRQPRKLGADISGQAPVL